MGVLVAAAGAAAAVPLPPTAVVIPAARIATPARVRVARRWVMEGLSANGCRTPPLDKAEPTTRHAPGNGTVSTVRKTGLTHPAVRPVREATRTRTFRSFTGYYSP